MAKTYSKEWNRTLIEVKNESSRTELVIDGSTVDFFEGLVFAEGKNDYLRGYDGENHIEIRFQKIDMIIFSNIRMEFYYNDRKIYECNM